MLPEDQLQHQHQNQRSSNSSSAGCGTRSCRKIKQKKVPQRGLGVAQLEKIRLEEQQKKEAAAGSSSCFVVPLPADASSPNSHFQAGISIPNLEIFNPPPPPLPVPITPYMQRDIITKQVVSGPLTMIWNGLRFDQHDVDPLFSSRSLLHNDPIPPSGLFSTKQLPQLQQLSSLVNVSPPSSSSGVNLQMEPPSNQSYCSNSTPIWPEEERMAGLKRSWPFAVEHAPGSLTSYLRKLPTFTSSSNELEEFTGVPDSFKFDPGSTIFREGPGPSSNTVQLEYPNPGKCTKQSGAMDGGFLSLAPPTTPLISKFKQPISYDELDSHRNQGSMEEVLDRIDRSKQEQSLQQQPFYSFFPAGPTSSAATSSDRRGNGAESVDLNLKL
ncbi:protein SPEAR2 [Aristolochia californica]|uniref:protein SPEAR2 n=1 Tax=Aristolochia californica TaxID=171875 RepID=UPI0035DDC253